MERQPVLRPDPERPVLLPLLRRVAQPATQPWLDDQRMGRPRADPGPTSRRPGRAPDGPSPEDLGLPGADTVLRRLSAGDERGRHRPITMSPPPPDQFHPD